jgi:hypothetical protein
MSFAMVVETWGNVLYNCILSLIDFGDCWIANRNRKDIFFDWNSY